jgi:hypothetical protein
VAASGSEGAVEAALAFLVQHCQVRAGLWALGGALMHAQGYQPQQVVCRLGIPVTVIRRGQEVGAGVRFMPM